MTISEEQWNEIMSKLTKAEDMASAAVESYDSLEARMKELATNQNSMAAQANSRIKDLEDLRTRLDRQAQFITATEATLAALPRTGVVEKLEGLLKEQADQIEALRVMLPARVSEHVELLNKQHEETMSAIADINKRVDTLQAANAEMVFDILGSEEGLSRTRQLAREAMIVDPCRRVLRWFANIVPRRKPVSTPAQEPAPAAA